MAVRAGGAYIDIEAKLDSFKKDLDKQVVRASKDAGDRASKSMVSSFKGVGAVIAGSFVAEKAFDFVGDALSGAREAAKIGRATEQVIKSTGGAARVTSGHVSDLAEDLSLVSGVDDDLIQNNENLLLTFTNVQNRVGKGNKIFDDATAAALDMSVAMGEDMKSSTIRLGKALNDPIKGLTSLSKVGVTFTDQQKDQIKAMVESGDVAGAQKVILAELGKEFGGQAAAQADAGAKAAAAWDNAKEAIGERLLPIAEKAATFFAEHLPGALAATQRGIDAVVAFVREHWPQVQQIISVGIERVRVVVQNVLNGIAVFWQAWGGRILAFVNLTWEGIRQRIQGAIQIVQGIIKTVLSIIRGDWSGAWEGIKQILSGAWDFIIGTVKQAIALARLAVQAGMALVAATFSLAWDGIKTLTGNAVDAVYDFFARLPARISSLALSVYRSALGIGSEIIQGIAQGVSGAVGVIGDIASAIGNGIKNFINTEIIDRVNSALEISLDLGFAGSISIDPPDIPRLHSGGIFRAPFGQTEGLALLRDNELVVTPEQQRSGRGSGVTIINQFQTDPDQMLGALRRHERLYANA